MPAARSCNAVARRHWLTKMGYKPGMKRIAVVEAKVRLCELLAEVEQGEQFTITRHGAPVALLIGAGAAPSDRGVAATRHQQVTLAFRALTALRKGITLDLPLREAIDRGRD
jgi:prevent-host-death family protein